MVQAVGEMSTVVRVGPVMSSFMTVGARRKIVVLEGAEEMLPAVTVKGGTDVGVVD